MRIELTRVILLPRLSINFRMCLSFGHMFHESQFIYKEYIYIYFNTRFNIYIYIYIYIYIFSEKNGLILFHEIFNLTAPVLAAI